MVAAQNYLVADLSPEERRVVEKLLRKRLADSASFELRVLPAATEARGDEPSPETLSRLQEARLAVAERTKDLSDQDLDEILEDRPLVVEARADRR